MTAAPVTVVVPTYNRTALLLECLRSLDAQTVAPSETIVVDDGSTEDVAGRVGAAFPRVRVVRLDRNRGFCGAANAGLRAAQTPYIFLLNNDMTLALDAIERLMQRAEPRTILTPLVLFASDSELIYCAGDRVLTSGRPEAIGFRARRDTFPLPDEVFGATGGAMLLPRAVLDAVGGFDETFVAYFEDADLCMRARLAGYACALAPDAVAHHVGSASLDGKTWWRSRQCSVNHGLLVIKNYPLSVLFRFLPAVLRERWHQAGMALSSARAEFGLAVALTTLAGATARLLMNLPRALAARARIQRRRSITGRAFAALLTRPEGTR